MLAGTPEHPPKHSEPFSVSVATIPGDVRWHPERPTFALPRSPTQLLLFGLISPRQLKESTL